MIDDARALLSIAQMDVLEIHTWNSRTDRLEEPDRVVIDLDPGPEVAWREVVAAAREVRDALAALQLEACVKTTGGVGLHVVVPIAPRHDWRTCLAFARGFAETLERHAPARYTTAFARRGRERKILVDYLRNNRTNTSVAAFSTRARPGLPVSVPISWDELDARRPPRWDVRNVPDRVRCVPDPWGRSRVGQRLSTALLHAVGVVRTLVEEGPAMRTLLALVITLSLAGFAPRPASAQDTAPAGGRIESDRFSIEFVQPHHGREIRTDEGFLRVEEGPDLDDSDEVGSFTVYHPAAFDPPAQPRSLPPDLADVAAADPKPAFRRDGLVDTTAPEASADPCRTQRGKYLGRVLAMSGIQVDRPLELLDALGGTGRGRDSVLISGWLIPGVDPLKPLAWDQELRSLARDLATCQARAAPATRAAPR